jgi:hypothetical protein
LESLTDSFKLLLYIDKYAERRLVEVRLEDAVAAVERTIGSDIEDVVPAAKISSGAGAGFESLAGKGNKPKGFFVQIKLVGPLESALFTMFFMGGALEPLHHPLRKGIVPSIPFQDRRFDSRFH